VSHGLQACEWTGACGQVGEADCSNRCIASASVLGGQTSPGTPQINATLENSSVLGCNYVATLIATINGYTDKVGRRLSQLGGVQLSNPPIISASKCPDDAAVDMAVKSPLFMVAKVNVLPALGASPDLISAAGTRLPPRHSSMHALLQFNIQRPGEFKGTSVVRYHTFTQDYIPVTTLS
jgi:hypothetical protein